ncbi:hypothetical protein KW849_26655 [Pseudomonas sp. PDM26]|uniref:hypothetical protein n=1 Tax=Pseudomonas sp. PDM26 TaxID=2854766 RepID=UPI001C45A35D|nr:hypothetical protein [Pseudomonas sp. PDM26]MBV7549868.1 hypothetical protein [Pseudomonas sp. PDM26]
MRKDKFVWDETVSFGDYKMDHVYTETMRNFASTERWLYLGADAGNSGFAKIGITTGDLSSRSYSSTNPNYYLFCAFKCNYDLPKEELASIEYSLLAKIDSLYRNSDGTSKRMSHHESGVLSECFCPVDFQDFFVTLHQEIYDNFRHKFVISGMENEIGDVDGEFVDCIFSQKIANPQNFRRLIIQY